MDTGGEPHFGGESNSASGDSGTIRLLNSHLQMRGVDGIADLVPQFGKQFCNEIVSCEPVPVLRLEEFFPNNAVGIDEEESGTGHAQELAHGFCIQHLIRANGRGLGVGKQREVDLLPSGKKLQDVLAVVADRRDFEPLLLKSSLCVLQLDQLPFAVWSPIGGTKEEDDRALGSPEGRESLFAAKLIASGECRSLLSDVQSNRCEQFEGGDFDCIALKVTCDRNGVSQMTDRLVLRIQRIKLPDRIVIQNEFCPRATVFGAPGSLGESFVQGAIAVDDHARPRAGGRRIALSHQCVAGDQK